MSFTEVLLNIIVILFATLVMIRSFNEWLVYNHPMMCRAIWLLLLPAYTGLLIETFLSFMLHTSPPGLLVYIRIISASVFIFTGVAFSILLSFQHRKHTENLSKTH